MMSLGYVLMNWTAVIKHDLEQKRRKRAGKGKKNQNLETCLQNKIDALIQTEDTYCQECLDYGEALQAAEAILTKVESERLDIIQKLNQSKSSLALALNREAELRQQHEQLELEGAQLRYEMTQMRDSLAAKLAERDEAHAERIRMMEKLLEENGDEWACRNEQLQNQLGQALTSCLAEPYFKQEIASLQTVIELRSMENRNLRAQNNDLTSRLERHHWLEGELANARQRLKEISIVLQDKITSERELLELGESMQQQLVQSREELLKFKRELENRQYLIDHNSQRLPANDLAGPDLKSRPHRNHHQQASYGNKTDPDPVVWDVREKNESVAWMIQMPTSPSGGNTTTTHRNRE